MNQLKSPSYMEMRLDLDGKDPLLLRIPTFWDAVELRWIGAVKTPITKKLISAVGEDSTDLQNNFNIEISKIFEDPTMTDEVFSMFKPLEEWE